MNLMPTDTTKTANASADRVACAQWARDCLTVIPAAPPLPNSEDARRFHEAKFNAIRTLERIAVGAIWG